MRSQSKWRHMCRRQSEWRHEERQSWWRRYAPVKVTPLIVVTPSFMPLGLNDVKGVQLEFLLKLTLLSTLPDHARPLRSYYFFFYSNWTDVLQIDSWSAKLHIFSDLKGTKQELLNTLSSPCTKISGLAQKTRPKKLNPRNPPKTHGKKKTVYSVFFF